MWVWALLLITAVVLSDKFWFALATVGVATVVVLIRSDGSPWNRTYWLSLKIGAFIIFVRTLFGIMIGVPIPGTTLFTIPRIDLPSWMPGISLGGAVTLERLSS